MILLLCRYVMSNILEHADRVTIVVEYNKGVEIHLWSGSELLLLPRYLRYQAESMKTNTHRNSENKQRWEMQVARNKAELTALLG